MESRRFYIRVAILMVMLGVMLSVFSFSLYDLQIIRGEDFLEQSSRKSGVTVTVESARGAILDRYGRVLVSNRLSYNLSLDSAYLGEPEARNETLLALLALCGEKGIPHTDFLPISRGPRFYDTSGRLSAVYVTRYESYLKKKGLDAALSPAEVFAALREEYSIHPDWSDEMARPVVGVCYELDLRAAGVTGTPYVLAQDVDVELISAVKEHGWPGINIDLSSVREYRTQYAAHLLGRVGLMSDQEWQQYKELGYSLSAIVGKEGVERAFESYLHGVPGSSIVDKNASGKVVGETTVTPPKPGGNVHLTLDIKLQEAVEKALSDFVPSVEGAEGAAAVAIKIGTGELLAAASYPTYRLEEFGQIYGALLEDPLRPMVNRALQGTYAPGSTFKMVTAVAALEEGIIAPNTRIRDTGVFTVYKDYQPTCWIYRQFRGTHGLVSVTEALNVSCNVFFYTLGYQMGIDLLNYYAAQFGLGRATGVELNEVVGVVAGPAFSESIGATWVGGNTLSAAIGQSDNQFTPIQLANYIAALAGGGAHYKTHLLKSVSSFDFSETIHSADPELMNQIPMQESTLNAVKAGLLKVTSPGGSAYRYFQGFDIPVGAKTGSAQVDLTANSNAVFVCFAPYDEPEIALAIVVEKGGTGAELGIVARMILDYYFSADAGMDRVATEGTLLR